MDIFKTKPGSVLFLFLILYFAAIELHADNAERSLFVENRGLFEKSCLPGLNRLPGADRPALWPPYGPGIDSSQLPGRRPTMLKLILGGVAGNLAGTIGLVMLGNEFPSPGDEIIASAAVAGFFVGTIGGSALGVCLAGNTRYWRGKAGSALLGSTLGLLSAFLVSAILPYTFQNLGVVYFSFLPPLGAAVLFNSTLGRRFTRSQGALFSFSRGSVKMGVPDLDVRPLFIPGIDAGPEPQFKVKILSVEL